MKYEIVEYMDGTFGLNTVSYVTPWKICKESKPTGLRFKKKKEAVKYIDTYKRVNTVKKVHPCQ